MKNEDPTEKVLKYLRKNPDRGRADIAAGTKLAPVALSALLSRMRSAGQIVKCGNTRAATYRAAPK